MSEGLDVICRGEDKYVVHDVMVAHPSLSAPARPSVESAEIRQVSIEVAGDTFLDVFPPCVSSK